MRLKVTEGYAQGHLPTSVQVNALLGLPHGAAPCPSAQLTVARDEQSLAPPVWFSGWGGASPRWQERRHPPVFSPGTFSAPWAALARSTEQYCLAWEAKYLMELGNALETILSGLANMVAQEALKYTVLSGKPPLHQPQQGTVVPYPCGPAAPGRWE